MKVNFLLGAGFSIPAGYPSGLHLNESFFNKVENRLLKSTSLEWYWDEHGEVRSHNGRLNVDHLKYSYLLSEYVEQFQQESHKTFNYEEFFDWFKEKVEDDNAIQRFCETVNERLFDEFQIEEDSLHVFQRTDSSTWSEVFNIYNHLIADLLNRKYSREENIGVFSNFIKTVLQYDEANIFSLNHDLLTEYLLNENHIPYSDGFSKEKSFIIGSENEPLPLFQNIFSESVRLFKLHGSVDYYIYDEGVERGARVSLTGNYWFYKPLSYNNKHQSRRVDENGKVIQTFPQSKVYPQFLTGKTKDSLINDHSVYTPMFDAFKSSFEDLDILIIIGYSYGDVHINKILKENMDANDFKIININPGMSFPFRKNYKNDFVEQLSSIEELDISQ